MKLALNLNGDQRYTMETLTNDICQAINENRLNLPPLPETCLKVRKLLQEDNSSAKQLSNTIAIDTALSARILKVANSALYARQQSAGDLHTAIQRLGSSLIGNLVNGLAIMPLFSNTKNQQQDIESRIKQHSMSTATIAYGLCQRYKHLNYFECYLAAMLQNIGYLAILSYQKLPSELTANKDAMINFLTTHHINVGSCLLKHWQFPETVIEIQHKHGNFFRTHSKPVDYLDIIIAANAINGPIFASSATSIPSYMHIPAMQRLNITETSLDNDMEEIRPGIQEARFIFQTTG